MEFEFPWFFVTLAFIFIFAYIVWRTEDSNRERARMERLHKATRERRKV